MKKRLAAVVLAACIASCGLWACASQSGGAESAGDGAAQDQEAKASEQDDLEAQADAIKLLQGKEKVVAAQEFYAPKVTTTKDGTEVQLIPNDPYLWNTAILDGENRGCTAAKCHTSILDATQLLPMSHPELWNLLWHRPDHQVLLHVPLQGAVHAGQHARPPYEQRGIRGSRRQLRFVPLHQPEHGRL